MSIVTQNILRTGCALLFLAVAVTSCGHKNRALSPEKVVQVKQAVSAMMNSITKDLAAKGPVGWLSYFDQSADFFMASDGKVFFPTGDSAIRAVNHTLSKQIRAVSLRWDDVRIDPLTEDFAVVGAGWKEQLTDFSNTSFTLAGYFTAVAENTNEGWRLKSVHWSAMK